MADALIGVYIKALYPNLARGDRLKPGLLWVRIPPGLRRVNMSYIVEEERLEAFVMKRLDCFRNIEFVDGGFSNWGSKEAVETQAITLLECECLVRAPEKLEKDPRIVMVRFTTLR